MSQADNGWKSKDERVEDLQMATINMDVRISTMEDLLMNEYGGMSVDQEELMKQLMNAGGISRASSVVDEAISRESIRKMQAIMESQSVTTGRPMPARDNPYGLALSTDWRGSDSVGETTASSAHTHSMATAKVGIDIGYIDTIIDIRNKLDDFLDGSNVLLKVMNPQTIREMVRELRNEIRTIKREENISELDIVEYLEEELADEENRKADAQERINKYDADNEIPF